MGKTNGTTEGLKNRFSCSGLEGSEHAIHGGLGVMAVQGFSRIRVINAKLTLYETAFECKRFQQQVGALKDSWHRDLRPLLAQVPGFTMVQERVLHALAR